MTKKEQKIRFFMNTVAKVTKAQTIEQAESIATMATGYMVGLRMFKAISLNEFDAMDKLLAAALEAAKECIKKSAPGATNTKSGRDNSTNFSITILWTDVKREGEAKC